MTETFQLSIEGAETYEERFVPALFADWAPRTVGAAGIRPGQRVLDVACGTGIVARTAAEIVGDDLVAGLDLNRSMLSVAERIRPDIEWCHGDAQDIPFPDETFDVVLCQSALMFFPDMAGAVREMARVLAPGGTLAIQVWGSIDTQPGYGPLVEAAARHAGPEARTLLGVYWSLGELDLVTALVEGASLASVTTTDHLGTGTFPSVEAMVRTEVDATPLGDRIDDEVYEAILADTQDALAGFVTTDATVVPVSGHIVTARKP